MRFLPVSLLSLLLPAMAFAQPARDGIPDPRFGTNGVFAWSGDVPAAGARFRVRSDSEIVAQPDGKLLLVAAALRTGQQHVEPALVRLTREGALDTGFGQGGLFVLAETDGTFPPGGYATGAVARDDGSVVVVGARFASSGGDLVRPCAWMFAVEASGQLLSDYGPGPGPSCLDLTPATGSASQFAIGNVARGPGATVYINTIVPSAMIPSAVVARLDGTGRLDAGFAGDGIAEFGSSFDAGLARRGLVRSSDGELFVLGVSDGRGAVAKLDDTGTPVSDFGNGGVAQWPDAFGNVLEYASSFDITPSGGLVALVIPSGPASHVAAVAMLDANGSTDLSFNANAQQPGGPGRASLFPFGENVAAPDAIRARGSRVVVTSTSLPEAPVGTDFVAAQLQSDGAYDGGFGAAGIGVYSYATPMDEWACATAMLGDGSVAVVGTSGVGNPVVLKFVDDALLLDQFE